MYRRNNNNNNNNNNNKKKKENRDVSVSLFVRTLIIVGEDLVVDGIS